MYVKLFLIQHEYHTPLLFTTFYTVVTGFIQTFIKTTLAMVQEDAFCIKLFYSPIKVKSTSITLSEVTNPTIKSWGGGGVGDHERKGKAWKR